MTLTDSGPLVAIPNPRDQYHQKCTDALPSVRLPMVSSLPCVIEALHLLGREYGWHGQKQIWALRAAGKLIVLDLPSDGLDRIVALMEKYSDAPMDAADASLVVLAEEHGFEQIFTLDSRFAAFRKRDRKALRLIP